MNLFVEEADREREGQRLVPLKNSVQRSRLQMIGLRKMVCKGGDSRGMNA